MAHKKKQIYQPHETIYSLFYKTKNNINVFIADIRKPKWKDAPPWANWLSMDEDCWWYWTEAMPNYDYGFWSSGGKFEFCKKQWNPHVYRDWRNMKEKRPVFKWWK